MQASIRVIGLLILLHPAALVALSASEMPARWQREPIAFWCDQLQAEDVRQRWYAAYALGQYGPKAAEAVPRLTAILGNLEGHEYVRTTAAWALGRIGVVRQTVVATLTESLSSQLPSVRRNAAEALGRLGPEAKTAVPALRARLDDSDPAVCVNAAMALWSIDRHPSAVTSLERILRDGKAPGPRLAVASLGRLGAPVEAVVPTLVAALGHADADVRRGAARALGQVGPESLPALKAPLDGSAETARVAAVQAMGWMGPVAVRALSHALKNDNAAVRRAAASQLGRLGPSARDAEPALVEAVSDRDIEVREAAAKALRKIRDLTNR